VRPLDPRLLSITPATRRFAMAAGLLALATAVAVIAQATLLARIVTDVFLDGEGLGDVAWLIALLGVAALARGVLAWALEAGGHLAATAATGELRRRLVAHVLATGSRVRDSAALATAVGGGVDALDPYFARYLPRLAQAAVLPLAILLWVAAIDLESAIVMAVTLPLIPIFGALVGRDTARRARNRYAALTALSGHFLSVVRGLPTLRAFNRGGAQAERIGAVEEAYRRETMATLRIAFLSAFVLELAAMLGTAVVAVEIGIRLDDGGIGLAAAMTVLVLAPELYLPVRAVAAEFHASADGTAAAGAIFAELERGVAVGPPASPLAAPDPARVPLRLEGVSFRHPGAEQDALDGITLAIEPGERVALVGPSGAGKTTLAALLLRFESPQRGRILAGAADLEQVDPAAWRERVAWVPQHPHLPSGTVAEAIAMGRQGAGLDAVHAAARLAQADAFIDSLPDGYATRIGDGGRSLSTGQVRRLALARALVRPGGLLVADEATAGLDAETAEAVAAALRALPRDRSMLLITHDPALAAGLADRVVRLEAGRIVPGAAQFPAVAR
jgi:thiol reductant ABC exporter CydD subunit